VQVNSLPSPLGENDCGPDTPERTLSIVTGTPVGDSQLWELPYASIHDTLVCSSSKPFGHDDVSPEPVQVPSP
jgi:hypothetical protein